MFLFKIESLLFISFSPPSPKEVDRNDGNVDTEKWIQVSFFAVCPTASYVYFLHKRLNYGEKKFFVSIVHKNEVGKKKQES